MSPNTVDSLAPAPTVSMPSSPAKKVDVTTPAGLQAVLTKTRLFAQLSDAHLALLAAVAEPIKVGKGTVVVSEGQTPQIFAILVQGELHVHQAGKHAGALHPYDSFGFGNLFADSRSPSTLLAAGAASCFLVQISRAPFQALLAREPTLALALLPALAAHVPDAVAPSVKSSTSVVAGNAATATTPTVDVQPNGLPRDAANLVVKVFDSKPYQTKLFIEQNALPGFGFKLEFLEDKLSPATVHLAKGAHAVCVFVHDSVNPEVAQALADMGIEMVAYRCAGFDTCHVPTCDKLGISVARVPGYSPNAIAEHAAALMMALNRKLVWASSRVHNGDFSLDGLVGFDMKGKTVGIIGTGKIGACLVSIMLGFGCRVICQDVYKNPALLANPQVQYVEMDTLLAQSDIISIHAPLLPETHHLINETTLAKMKRGVLIINTSRGPLVDTKALIEALKSGQVGACGLDVVEGENDYFYENCSDSVVTNDQLAHLLSFQNRVMITAHQAFLTEEALREIAGVTLKNIAEFHQGKRLKHLANSVNNVAPRAVTTAPPALTN
ncbi:hypothetical protein H9P43_001705 [Blastocladiella emersonii ATCC 22665]|nr:hypothetical protein H9P43_001705 [Blastocladiella emersonii ATCC 22665]